MTASGEFPAADSVMVKLLKKELDPTNLFFEDCFFASFSGGY
jgi:hypothetical protein